MPSPRRLNLGALRSKMSFNRACVPVLTSSQAKRDRCTRSSEPQQAGFDLGVRTGTQGASTRCDLLRARKSGECALADPVGSIVYLQVSMPVWLSTRTCTRAFSEQSPLAAVSLVIGHGAHLRKIASQRATIVAHPGVPLPVWLAAIVVGLRVYLVTAATFLHLRTSSWALVQASQHPFLATARRRMERIADLSSQRQRQSPSPSNRAQASSMPATKKIHSWSHSRESNCACTTKSFSPHALSQTFTFSSRRNPITRARFQLVSIIVCRK